MPLPGGGVVATRCRRAPEHAPKALHKRTAAIGAKMFGPSGSFDTGTLEWPSLLKKLERERGASYRT